MTNTKLPSQVALDAVQILRERGHAKNILEDRQTGGVCLFGALSAAVDGKVEWVWGKRDVKQVAFEVLCAVDVVVLEQFPDRILSYPGNELAGQGQSIYMNNHDDTTIDDVILVLEKTAISLMEEGR